MVCLRKNPCGTNLSRHIALSCHTVETGEPHVVRQKPKSTAYKIGYCKSHRPTQFSKGRSSNPGGRHVVLLPSRGETAISLFGAKNSLFSAELSRFGAEQGILRNSLMLHREKV